MSVEPLPREVPADEVHVALRGELPLGVEEYAREKVAHVTRLSRRLPDAVSVLVQQHPARGGPVRARVEAELRFGGTAVRAEAEGARPREAVDRVVDRLERQLVDRADRARMRRTSRHVGVGEGPKERP